VTFLPDDLDMIKGGPARRREYVDELAAQLWPAAGAEQSEYDQTVRQRNALLRAEGPAVNRAELDAWDQRVATAGAAVVIRRVDLLHRLAGPLATVYDEIGPGPDGLAARYAPRGAGDVDTGTAASVVTDRLLDALTERRRVDMERRVTTVGPHRDDTGFFLGDRDTRSLASQGEQRSVALVLRLAADALRRDKFVAPPILVLDDVFSELDAARSEGVVSRLPGGQVFISTAREEDVPVSGRKWHVAGGKVE
jgi:DNA replication and repair protein RecF